MQTPAKTIITETLQTSARLTIGQLKEATRLSTFILYGSIMQLEDAGVILGEGPPGSNERTYRLASAAGSC